MNTVVSPHDKFFKLSMQEIKIAKDFFKHHVPEYVQKQMDFNSLHLEPESFIDQEQQAHFSDVLYSIMIDKKPGFLFILAEHQSKAEKLMPFRVLQYMCLIWNKHLKKQEKQKEKKGYLPIIYPLIFYHGRQAPYPYSCDLLDCFLDKVLAEKILHGPVQLIDVTQISDAALKKHGTAALFELMQKHIYERNMGEFLQELLQGGLIQLVSRETNGEYLGHVIKYVVNQSEIQDVKGFFAELTKALPHEEEKIMTIAEQLIQQGMQQGMQLGAAKIVQNLYRTLKNEEKVAELSHLSLQEVRDILKKTEE